MATSNDSRFSDAAIVETVEIIQAGRDAAVRLHEESTRPAPTLSFRETTMMKRAVRSGEREAADFITRNRGLVVNAAKKFMPTDSGWFDELVATLTVEVVRSLPEWDMEKGRFSTFMRFRLKQACQRSGLLTAAGIHVPSQTLIEQRSPGREHLSPRRKHLAGLADQTRHADSLDAPLGDSDGSFTLLDTLEAGDESVRPPTSSDLDRNHPWLVGLDDEAFALCQELLEGGSTRTFGAGGTRARRRVEAHLENARAYAMVG